MNGKTARNLRKLVKDAAWDIPDDVRYRDEVTYKEVQAGINEDGTPRKITVPRITKVLTNCQRYLYQRAKARHHLYTHN